jgi:hypothetical protein
MTRLYEYKKGGKDDFPTASVFAQASHDGAFELSKWRIRSSPFGIPRRGGATITIDMNFCELCISCRDCHREGLINGRHPRYGKISVDEFIESIHLACLFTIKSSENKLK